MSYKLDLNTAKIFIVDDEPEITEIVDTFLTEHGFQVLTENKPTLAIQKAKNYKPDVILLDIMMPGIDGYSICQGLKEDPEFYNTPVIFLTGKDKSDDMGRSFKSGGDMFIKKPFSCERLLEIVNIVLMSTGKF
ncbi:MAG TPA: response regulator [candidate division Zixibacteria bacterium]|nr:response regulator [candidate division Zixibacteria bacterium]